MGVNDLCSREVSENETFIDCSEIDGDVIQAKIILWVSPLDDLLIVLGLSRLAGLPRVEAQLCGRMQIYLCFIVRVWRLQPFYVAEKGFGSGPKFEPPTNLGGSFFIILWHGTYFC